MDTAITVGDVVWFVLVLGGVAIVLAILFGLLAFIGSEWNH